MADIKHKKCGGNISIDVAQAFVLRSPSIIISPEGLSVGVLELDISNKKSGGTQLMCNSCSSRFDPAKDLENLVATCLFCRKQHSLTELWCSHYFPCICTSCKNILTGKTKTDSPDSIRKLLPFFHAEEGEIKFTLISEILKSPVVI